MSDMHVIDAKEILGLKKVAPEEPIKPFLMHDGGAFNLGLFRATIDVHNAALAKGEAPSFEASAELTNSYWNDFIRVFMTGPTNNAETA